MSVVIDINHDGECVGKAQFGGCAALGQLNDSV